MGSLKLSLYYYRVAIPPLNLVSEYTELWEIGGELGAQSIHLDYLIQSNLCISITKKEKPR